jgi:hypothetical protein
MPRELPAATVHSIGEAFLYVMTIACPACGKGPMRTAGDAVKAPGPAGAWRLSTICTACGESQAASFMIDPPPTRHTVESDRINPTSEPSRAIDLVGWLSLFESILKASQQQADRQAARQLAYEAAQCLDEALKFYDSDNEMPPAAAFFSEASQARFRDHPEHFARSRWRQRRLMLPDIQVRTRPAAPASRRWWQFWRARSEP